MVDKYKKTCVVSLDHNIFTKIYFY